MSSKKKTNTSPEVTIESTEATNEKKYLAVSAHKKIFYIISASLIAIILVLSFLGRFNLSIEFKGGTKITYSYTGEIDESKVTSVVKSSTGESAEVVKGESMSDSSKTITLSFASSEGLTNTIQKQLTTDLQKEFKDSDLTVYNSSDVSPSNGREFFIKCAVAVGFAMIIMVLYIAFRFRKIGGLSAACMAIVALFHDLIMVYGCFLICGFDIDANFMAVLLTILGYSINSTIIIYDRIRENKRLYGRKYEVSDLVDMSITQTLGRSVHTNVTTIMAMAVVCIVCVIYGVSSILSFAFPLIIGMLAGVYSSNCIAPTLWVCWQNHKKKKRIAAKNSK